MNRKRMQRRRIAMLNRARLISVGPFEKLALRIAGWADGRRALPRQIQDGTWVSPRLDREVYSLYEFMSKLWGGLQYEMEASYKQLREITDRIADKTSALEKANRRYSDAIQAEVGKTPVRMYGESELADEQVAARRARERSRKLSGLTARINELESAVSADTEKVYHIHSEITEADNTTRMIANCMENHLRQRMDVYWHSALKKHPDRARMPVVPDLRISPTAENEYSAPHIPLMRRAEQICNHRDNQE